MNLLFFVTTIYHSKSAKSQLPMPNKVNLYRRRFVDKFLEFCAYYEKFVSVVYRKSTKIILSEHIELLLPDIEINGRFLNGKQIFLTYRNLRIIVSVWISL